MKLTDKITLYVPTHLLGVESVGSLIREMTELCGGMTMTRGAGVWYNEDSVAINDPVALLSWWFAAPNIGKAHDKSRKIARAMLEHGESSVLVEDSTPHRQVAELITLPQGED